MVTIDFSQRKNSSLTEFIYSQLKEQIISQILKPNEKLPSKRALANHLGVSVITTQNAYELLIAEGYIFSSERSGYYVTPLEENFIHLKKEKINSQHIKNLEIKNMDKILFEKNKDTEKINLSGNLINLEQFPFATWAKLMKLVLKESKEKILSSLPPQGIEELRNAISIHLSQFRNMNISSEQIIIGAGSEYLYTLILQLLGKNKIYGMENPGYTKITSILKSNNIECIPIPMDKKGISVDALENSNVSVVHVSPAHHFPTGSIMQVRRRQELLNWCSKHDNRFIIEDDYDSEFRFTGKSIDTLFSMDNQNKVIYINTFTKTISPSLRISYMVLPLELVKKFRQNLGFYSCTVSSIEQMTLASFISMGFYEKHLIRMKNYYRNLRDNLIFEIMNSPLKNLSKIEGKDAGLHFILKINSSEEDDILAKKIDNQGIKVSFISDYIQNENKKIENSEKSKLVINYSSLKKNQIPLVVKGLCKALINE